MVLYAAAARKLVNVSAELPWPADVPWPYSSRGFDTRSLLGKLVQETFSVPRAPYSRIAPGPGEFADRLFTADKRVTGFAQTVKERHDGLLIGLRSEQLEPEPEVFEPEYEEESPAEQN
jgi:hypothetical protein